MLGGQLAWHSATYGEAVVRDRRVGPAWGRGRGEHARACPLLATGNSPAPAGRLQAAAAAVQSERRALGPHAALTERPGGLGRAQAQSGRAPSSTGSCATCCTAPMRTASSSACTATARCATTPPPSGCGDQRGRAPGGASALLSRALLFAASPMRTECRSSAERTGPAPVTLPGLAPHKEFPKKLPCPGPCAALRCAVLCCRRAWCRSSPLSRRA